MEKRSFIADSKVGFTIRLTQCNRSEEASDCMRYMFLCSLYICVLIELNGLHIEQGPVMPSFAPIRSHLSCKM